MPSIILPSRCRQQPQGLVRAKQSFTDAAGGDAFLVNFAIPNVDVIGGRRLTSISHKDDPRFLRLFGETAYHPVGSYSASTTYSAIYDRPVTLTDQYTVILRVAGLYYGSHAILGNWYGGTNGVLFSLWSASGYYPSGDGPVGIRGSHQGIADLTGIEGIHKSINGPVTLVITGNESHYKAYSNGVLLGSISHSYAINNTDSNTLLHVGMPSGGGTLYGGIMLASVSGRLISDAHAREISRDPYGELFVPRRRVLYFETAGGGTIYNESLEETSTLIETYLSNVIYPISFTETAGLIDSNQASNITSTTITEVGGLQDSVAATQTLGALLNESATLTDSNTVLTTFNPTLTEQTVLQDSNDVLTTFNTTITDSLTGIDDYTGLVIFSATITETLTDPDSYIADVSVVINESIAGTDNYSVTVNYVTTLNETASAVDTISTSWVCSATLTEIQTLVDSISAYISGEEPTSFDIVSLKSFITRLLPTNSKITTSITKNSKL